ncbi:MAG: hypothetical protein CVU07_13295, partial [Bacteroidetes bacterium HGW-Bacteroidetes-23]
INEYKSLSFNYNKRINRPSYNNLNPFRFYSTPFNFAEGNPFLQPSFSDNFEISFVVFSFNVNEFPIVCVYSPLKPI